MTHTPQITIVAIIARNNAIGIDGDQPFHIQADFKRFKALTMDKPVIMGRRTFQALPNGALPGRRNIVVTSQNDFRADNAETAPSLEAAIHLAADSPEIMIIGGGQIYKQALPLASKLEITKVDADVPGADTFFPPINATEWHETLKSDKAVDPRSGKEYVFVSMQKI